MANVPGIERVARFGTRDSLSDGWRGWLLRSLGRADLEDVAPVSIAAAGLEAAFSASSADLYEGPVSTRWIATAVHLQAGLRRVRLDHRGLLRLSPEEQAALAGDFARTFGSSGYTLAPLPSGEFLLDTPGFTAVATSEPARCAGAELEELVPAVPAAAPLRRLLTEIEMWLHAQPLNEARRMRDEVPVTGLWPWGAIGRIVRLGRRAAPALPLAFGWDAWLAGLWRLQGSVCRAPPQCFEEVLAAGAPESVLLLRVGGELRRDQETVADALSRLDARFISPALEALRRGELDALTVILNDARVQVHRRSLRRLWRRGPSGLGGFA